MWYSLQRKARGTWWKILSTYYAQRCQVIGERFLVKGLMRLSNRGTFEVGNNCLIDSSWMRSVKIDVGRDAILKIGSQVYLNEGVNITCNISVSIGNRCLFAPEVVIIDDDGHPVDWQHRHDYWPAGPKTRLGAPVIIEDNVWLGTRAMVLKGVTIGAGAVIAAGAVVTRPVPAGTLVAGVPARVIRQIESKSR